MMDFKMELKLIILLIPAIMLRTVTSGKTHKDIETKGTALFYLLGIFNFLKYRFHGYWQFWIFNDFKTFSVKNQGELKKTKNPLYSSDTVRVFAISCNFHFKTFNLFSIFCCFLFLFSILLFKTLYFSYDRISA